MGGGGNEKYQSLNDHSFTAIPTESNSLQPIFQYFSTLFEIERLNKREDIELATPVSRHDKMIKR